MPYKLGSGQQQLGEKATGEEGGDENLVSTELVMELIELQEIKIEKNKEKL